MKEKERKEKLDKTLFRYFSHLIQHRFIDENGDKTRYYFYRMNHNGTRYYKVVRLILCEDEFAAIDTFFDLEESVDTTLRYFQSFRAKATRGFKLIPKREFVI